MRVLNIDLKRKIIEVIPTDYNDLWILYNFITKNDEVVAETYRTIKLESGEKIKKKFILKIKVEDISFSEYGFNLRIGGRILSEHEEIKKGAYHTINVSPGTKLTIIKTERIPDVFLNMIKRGEKEKILLVAMDNTEAAIGIYSNGRIKIIEEANINLSKKEPNYESELLKKLNELAKKIKEVVKKENIKNIVLASPLYYKEKLKEILSKFLDDENIFEINVSYGGINGIREALKRKEFENILEKIKIEFPIKKLRTILEELYKGKENIAIGFETIKKASELGAIEELFISERKIEDLKQRDEFEKLIMLFNEVETNRGKIYIIRRGIEEEEILAKLGGIIARLRFPLTF